MSGEGTQAGVGWAGLVGSEDEAESTLARGLAFIIVPVSTVLPEEAAEFPETLCSISNFPDTWHQACDLRCVWRSANW